MGSDLSVGCQQIPINLNHSKISNAKIFIKDSVSKLVCQIPTEKTLFQSWQKQIKSLKLNNQFIFLPQEMYYTQEGFCSTQGIAKVVYKNFPYLLKNQILDRAGRKQHFNQEDIWYLLYSIFSVKRQFMQKSINQGNVGNLTPQNIFLSENGSLKIACYLSWPGGHSFTINILPYEQRQFLAPQELIQIQMGGSYCKTCNFSELFSIGLTLLCVSVLKNCQDLYDYQRKKFDFNEFINRIQTLKATDRYSDALKAIIELLCSLDPNERLRIEEIDEILLKYPDQILLKKKFTIDKLPERIQLRIRNNHSQKQSFIDEILNQSQQFVEIITQTNQKPQQIELKKNSLNLTQVILGNQFRNLDSSKISECQSLYSGVEQVQVRKTHSELNSEKPLERYQQINANIDKESLSEIEDLNLIHFGKEVIIQNPIIIDKNRKSNDIEEQSTPLSTPKQISVIEQKQKRLAKTLQIPKLSGNYVQKNHLSKTANLNVNLKHSFGDSNLLKIKSVKSQDWCQQSGKQDRIKSQNPTLTMFIPIGNVIQQIRYPTQEVDKIKMNVNKYESFPEKIVEISKQCSQIFNSNLS